MRKFTKEIIESKKTLVDRLGCVMKTYDEKTCGARLGLDLMKKTFTIDGLILCPNHTEQYIHQCMSSVSVHREKFDILSKKMKFR